MIDRARSSSVVRNDDENPRTPESAATPIATESSTNTNLPRDDRISRDAIFAADPHERLFAI
jgi:hypothetical protein